MKVVTTCFLGGPTLKDYFLLLLDAGEYLGGPHHTMSCQEFLKGQGSPMGQPNSHVFGSTE